MHNITYKIYSSELKYKCCNILSLKWEDLSMLEVQEKFEWKYLNNPYDDKPIIILAFDKEKIVGFRAAVLQLYKKGKKIYKVYKPADAIVDPMYRSKGVFKKLNDNFISVIRKKGDSIIVNLTSNTISTKGYLKQGWKETNGIKNFYSKINIFNVITFKNKFSVEHDVDIKYRNLKYNAIFTRKVDANELAKFNHNHRNKDVLTNLRDREYYNWKYSYNNDKYVLVYCRYNDELQGYLILKNINNSIFTLEEYLVIDDLLFKVLVNKAMKICNITKLRSWAFSKRDKKALNKAGFIYEPIWFYNYFGKKRLPILIKKISVSDKKYLKGLDVLNISNWQLQMADRF